MKTILILFFKQKFFKIFLNYEQSYLGRIIIANKRHIQDLTEQTKEEWEDFGEVIKKLEPAIKKAFGAKMFNYNIMMNNAYKNNPPNPHVHIHLRPRYDKDVEFAGKTFIDPDFSFHYNRDRKEIEPEENRKLIIKEIQKYL